jgi:hypothetical protein
MRANEDFRDAIRDALKAIDPEVVTIMDRVRPPQEHFDARKLPKLPAADSKEFPMAALERMGFEMRGYARSDHREETQKMHERVIASPQVQSALGKAQEAQGEERNAAMHELRQLYRQEMNREFDAARQRRGDQGPDRDRDRNRDRGMNPDRDREKGNPGPREGDAPKPPAAPGV